MIKIKLNSFTTLDEGRVDDMKKKYPGMDDTIDKLATAPGNNKYLDWMMKHHNEAGVDEILNVVKQFNEKFPNMEKKDINQYEDFDELEWAVKSARPPKKQLEREGTLSIYEDEKFKISRPKNKEASCKLGSTTKWCIASTKGENFFDSYAEGGVQHFIIRTKNLPPEDQNHLIAYSFSRNFKNNIELEIHDAQDEEMDREDVSEVIGADNENKFFNIMQDHFLNAKIPSDMTPLYDKDTVERIKTKYTASPFSNDRYAGKSVNRLLDDMFGIDSRGREGDLMNNPEYNERNIRALLSLNNPALDEDLHDYLWKNKIIHKYIPKRLLKKIFDKFPERQFSEENYDDYDQKYSDNDLYESKIFNFNKDKKMFKLLR